MCIDSRLPLVRFGKLHPASVRIRRIAFLFVAPRAAPVDGLHALRLLRI
jgi:hypothetical protein